MSLFEDKTTRRLPLVAAVLVFAALWSLDFPKPYIDDLFYCGAGLNLTAGGDFSNPLLERQHFPEHYFFLYPPIHSYMIAGWMKLFGISARSLTGFQNLMYLVTAVATIAILRRHKAPVWLEFLAPLGVAAAFLPYGLRTEASSVALTMAGFVMIECGCRRSMAVFPAFLLMFLGGEIAPRLTLFSGALVLLAGFRLWQGSPAPGWRRWSFCLCALGALLAAGFIFLFLIDFRLGEFLDVFRFHTAHRLGVGKIQASIRHFFGILGRARFLFFLLMPVIFLFVLRKSKNEMFHRIAFIAFAFFLTALIGGVDHNAAWYAVLMLFFLAVSISRNPGRFKVALPVALSLLLLLAAGKSLMNIAGILSGEIQNDRGSQYAEAAQMRSTPEHPMLVDCAAARYVFDYRIPPGFSDFAFSAPFPGLSVENFFQPQDVYLVSSENNISYLNKWTLLDFPPPPRWSPFGIERWSFARHPREVFIIPAETCGGLRSAASAQKNSAP